MNLPGLKKKTKIHHRLHTIPLVSSMLSQLNPSPHSCPTYLGSILILFPIAQLIKNVPVFCGAQKIIIVFTTARRWDISWATWIQSTHWYTIILWYILILSPNAQLIRNFHSFYGTRRFITVYTTARHWTLSSFSRLHSTKLYPAVYVQFQYYL
jgi:hypothetical protein